MTNLDTIKQELKTNQAQLLDVREQDEWNEGHLKQAQLVALSQLSEGHEFKSIDREKKTYIHCRSGNRVQMAAPILNGLGFENLTSLQEGFDELAENGFEVAQ